MTSIVVLDSHTLNPGDLSWKELEALGSCRIYPRTAPPDVVPRSQGADILLTNKTPIAAETLGHLPALRYIGVLATGFDVVDTVAARARGIPVTNVPGYGTRSVAQHTWALILELANHAGDQARAVTEGRWARSLDWCYWDAPLIELAGLNLGIIGQGRIGREVAKIGAAFGMSVRYATQAGGSAELENVLGWSDVVTLHCPLTPATRNLINSRTLALMKPTAFVVNTSRGALVNEVDLAASLNAGRLGGAALDVLSTEPAAIDNPLPSARNCLITPHVAWATTAARRRLLATAIENIKAFLNESPQNVVN
jgi:glycerate dehydrogenase